MKDDFKITKGEEKQIQEILIFISLCNDNDKKIFEDANNKDRVEDYARLMTIARIFDFGGTLSALFCHAGDFADELCKYLSKIENDKDLIIKWVEQFIEDITNEKAKQLAKEHWRKKLTAIADKTHFTVQDLFFGKW